MIICRGFVVVVVVCVTAKYSDHMCVWAAVFRPLTLWRPLALPPATFLVFPVPVVLLTLCAAVSCVPAAPVDRLGLTVVTPLLLFVV